MANDKQRSASPVPTKESDSGDQDARHMSPSSDSNKGKEKEKLQPELDSAVDEDKDKPSGSVSSDSEASAEADNASSDPQPWQAIFAPQYNAYYFYNTQTNETTWTNPLEPSGSHSTNTPPTSTSTPAETAPSGSDTPPASASQYNALQAAALAQGIDPSLAHLDPSLLTGTASASGGPIPSFQAKFNARTGAFTRPDARTPGHLSEYERMKRMSEFYFDVGAWEEQLAQDKVEEEEGNGKKRKRPSKKDLERFKEQKRQKKIAKTAWLRT
ncbi:hypothetical protein NP233_g10138 [Leucocoprinus birnbaumii]|uniref:WW domain-containing protein n=1 Tax=Leucocoprinus birnbaumii TaxID=56174 RepID=A0AAD5VPS9_9AGAR|nr:hypothetical protein NP233_g10138 [Leucocoprinus birnbaumii]